MTCTDSDEDGFASRNKWEDYQGNQWLDDPVGDLDVVIETNAVVHIKPHETDPDIIGGDGVAVGVNSSVWNQGIIDGTRSDTDWETLFKIPEDLDRPLEDFFFGLDPTGGDIGITITNVSPHGSICNFSYDPITGTYSGCPPPKIIPRTDAIGIYGEEFVSIANDGDIAVANYNESTGIILGNDASVTNNGRLGVGSSSEGIGIEVGANSEVTNQGQIFVTSHGDALGIFTPTGSQLTNEGDIYVDSEFNHAIGISAGDIRVSNSGVIGVIGDTSVGIAYTGSDPINNSGTIVTLTHRETDLQREDAIGILINATSEDVQVVNSGGIAAFQAISAVASSFGIGVDNSGIINGAVVLSSSDDNVTNSGLMVGPIDGGEGVDSFTATGGQVVGDITNFETFVKSGSDKFVFEGHADFDTVSIEEGGMIVNGSLASDIIIPMNSFWGGNSDIFGNFVNNGTLSPGNSIGTVTVSGDYSQGPDGVLEIEVNMDGFMDQLVISGAADLGGTLIAHITPASGDTLVTEFEFLTASGGVNGVFDNLVDANPDDSLVPELSYGEASVTLHVNIDEVLVAESEGNELEVVEAVEEILEDTAVTLAETPVEESEVSTEQPLEDTAVTLAETPVEESEVSTEQPAELVASAVEADAPTDEFQDFISNALNSDPLTAQQLLSQLANSLAPNAANVAFSSQEGIMTRISSFLADHPRDKGYSFWLSGQYDDGEIDGGAGISDFTYDGYGVTGGLTIMLRKQIIIGLGVANDDYDMGIDAHVSSGDVDLTHITGFVGVDLDDIFVEFGVVGSFGDMRTKRSIAYDRLSYTAIGETDISSIGGWAEGRYTKPLGAYALTPFVGLRAVSFDFDGLTETGAGTLDLVIKADDATSIQSRLGMNLGWSNDARRGQGPRLTQALNGFMSLKIPHVMLLPILSKVSRPPFQSTALTRTGICLA